MDLRVEDGVSRSFGMGHRADIRLADLKIFGPGGNGDPAPAVADPTRYTCEYSPAVQDAG